MKEGAGGIGDWEGIGKGLGRDWEGIGKGLGSREWRICEGNRVAGRKGIYRNW